MRVNIAFGLHRNAVMSSSLPVLIHTSLEHRHDAHELIFELIQRFCRFVQVGEPMLKILLPNLLNVR
ncbi:hypothetical protein D3C78_1876190 [compost metagenome]